MWLKKEEAGNKNDVLNFDKAKHNKLNQVKCKNFKSRIQSFLVDMLENPLVIKEYRHKGDLTEKDKETKRMYFANFREGENERIESAVLRNGIFRNDHCTNNNLKYSNKLSKSASLPDIIQPSMIFKARNDIERIQEAVSKNDNNSINPKVKHSLMKRLSVAVKNNDSDNDLIYSSSKHSQEKLNFKKKPETTAKEKDDSKHITVTNHNHSNHYSGSDCKRKGLEKLKLSRKLNKLMYKDNAKKTYFKSISTITYDHAMNNNDNEDKTASNSNNNQFNVNEENEDDNYSSSEEENRVINYNYNSHNNNSYKSISNKPRKASLNPGSPSFDDLNQLKDNKSPLKQQHSDFSQTKLDKLYFLSHDTVVDPYKEKLKEKKRYANYLGKVSKAMTQSKQKKGSKLLSNPVKFFENFYFRNFDDTRINANKMLASELGLGASANQLAIAAEKVLKICNVSRENKLASVYHRSMEGKLCCTKGVKVGVFMKEFNLK